MVATAPPPAAHDTTSTPAAAAPPPPAPRTDAVGDLLIVGAGTLGTRVAAAWRALPGARGDAAPPRVVAETRSTDRHARLTATGAEPRTRADADAAAGAAPDDSDGGRFANVVFSMTPRSADDYGAEAARAAALWAGPAGGGRLVFTSSTSALAEKGGGAITEHGTPADGRVTAAEAVIRDRGGVVVRLGGLYALRVGGHTRFVGTAEAAMPRRLYINMLHYDDAAAAVVAALRLPRGAPTDVGGAPFVATDGVPLTVEALVAATMAHERFAGRAGPALPTDPGVMGKRIDGAATRAALGWAPVHTYEGFWRGNCTDNVNA